MQQGENMGQDFRVYGLSEKSLADKKIAERIVQDCKALGILPPDMSTFLSYDLYACIDLGSALTISTEPGYVYRTVDLTKLPEGTAKVVFEVSY